MANNKNLPPPAAFVDPVTGLLTRQANNFLNAITASSNEASAGEILTPAGSGLEGGGVVADGLTLSIAPEGVTNAMLRDSLALSVIGRYAATDGPPADIVATADNRVLARIGGLLAFYDTALIPATVADGDYGDITVSGTGTVWTIDANVVTDAKFRQSAALSVVGRSANSTGNVADISAGTDNQVLRRSGTAIGFGAVNLASSDAVTGILAAANGGTSNGFTAFSGPASTTKTFSLPNASDTIVCYGTTGTFTALQVFATSVIASGASGAATVYDRSTGATDSWSLYVSSGAFKVFQQNGTTDRATFSTGGLAVAGVIKTASYLVANLPAAGTVGAGSRAFVTDANATTFASIVAGSGANGVPVYSDGTNWRIG